jgi:hypothetical protein
LFSFKCKIDLKYHMIFECQLIAHELIDKIFPFNFFGIHEFLT